MRTRTILTVLAIAMVSAATWPLAGFAEARVGQASVQVQLIDAGAKPRAVLRLTPAAVPASRTLTFTSQLSQSGVSTGSVGPIQVRTVVSTMTGIAGPNGTIRVPFAYGNLQLLATSQGSPQQLDAVRTSLAQSQGFTGEYTLSSTGRVLANRFSIPATANATLRGFLDQLSSQSDQLTVPLPTQAIGVGARWRGTTQLTAGGVSVRQTYEYTLQSRAGSRLTLGVRYTQTAPRQKAALPGLSAGVTVDVTSYRVTGTGTTVLDLSQVLPVNGHIAATGVQQFRVRQGSQSGTLTQHVGVGIDIAGG